VLAGQGEVVPARARLEHAIAVLDRIEGADSLAAADAREPLMELTFAAQGPAATLPIVEHRLATYRRVLGERDVRTALSWSDLGAVLTEIDRDDEAEAAYVRSAAVLDEILPANDPRAAFPHNNLAMFYQRFGRLEEAERAGRRALEIRRTALGESHPETAQTMATFAHVLAALGRHGEAVDMTRTAIAAVAAVDKVGALRMQTSLGYLLLEAGRLDDALVELDTSIPALAAIIGEDHVLVLRPRYNRAMVLKQLGRREEARRELEKLLPVLERQGDRSEYLTMVRSQLEELESSPES
jgi:serine/threonine-protein kinase